MKKLAYISIGAIFTLVVSFSWITWADSTNTVTGQSDQTTQTTQTTGSQSSTTLGEISFLDQATGDIMVFDGKQKHSFKTDSQTKVLINQKEDQLSKLQLGDQVEVVCNSDGIVRYVVLTKDVAGAAQPASSGVANSQPTLSTTTQNKVSVQLKQGEKVIIPVDQIEKWLEENKSSHDNGKHKGRNKNKKEEHDDKGKGHDD
jgi:Phr family secreted Rap phosphatase inhibitor